MDLERTPFNLGKVMGDVMSLFRLSAAKKGLTIDIAVDPAIPDSLIGDPFRLRQIISNLIGNAVKYTHEGKIFVSIRMDACHDTKIKLEFSVLDTGIGIPADKIQFLFKSFNQVDNSNTRKYGGTGLGLSIAKRLVELMDGEIWVESWEGKGSRFCFNCMFDRIDTESDHRRTGPIEKDASDQPSHTPINAITACALDGDREKCIQAASAR